MVARHCPSNSWWESRSECWWCHGQAPIHVTLLTPAPSVIRSRNNEEWIIVFCRHTNVTQLLQVTACSDVHIAAPRWQLITIVCSQVSLWRCLFRPPMTGWWHGAGQWSAGRLMVYRGTPRWDPVQGTLPLLAAPLSVRRTEQEKSGTDQVYQAALIQIYLNCSREKIVYI